MSIFLNSIIFSSRAPFSFDLLIIILTLILPILSYSIYVVKVKQNYRLHKKLQIFISILLLITILVFEVDVRLNGWIHLAKKSPYYNTILWPVLYIHLILAISVTILWILVFTRAIRRIKLPPDLDHKEIKFHKKFASLASIGLYLATLTGILFYYFAFLAG